MDFQKDVREELLRARKGFPAINSLHEGYAVILEELDEFWDECKKQHNVRSPAQLHAELVQVAAMCQRTAEDALPRPLEVNNSATSRH